MNNHADRNSQESIENDIQFLEAMRENAQHLHDIEADTAASEYLLTQINDWVSELRNYKRAQARKALQAKTLREEIAKLKRDNAKLSAEAKWMREALNRTV